MSSRASLPLPDEVTGSKRMDSLMAASRNFKRPRSPQSSARAGLSLVESRPRLASSSSTRRIAASCVLRHISVHAMLCAVVSKPATSSRATSDLSCSRLSGLPVLGSLMDSREAIMELGGGGQSCAFRTTRSASSPYLLHQYLNLRGFSRKGKYLLRGFSPSPCIDVKRLLTMSSGSLYASNLHALKAMPNTILPMTSTVILCAMLSMSTAWPPVRSK
mmetsp:Transcript_1178/g.2806  ORF Transcript_1178/g.2806 Transcript_1178/m.2806 type:complete len:218 (+) Transcript_1178:1275-1928(+)